MIKQIAIKGYDDNFSYFVKGNGNEVAIVDPGDVEMLEEIMAEEGLTPAMILLTHSHHDHVGGVSELVEKYGLPVYAHANTEGRINTGGGELLYLKDGDIIELDGLQIKALYTPGHIDDALCYLVDEKELLTGDTLFVEGCGRADFPESDVRELWKSLCRIKALNDEILIYPGHDYGSKPVSTIGWEKKHNKYLCCENFEEFMGMRMST